MGTANPSGPNPNFQYRNPNQQQYVQRNVGQSYQLFQQQNQQQWLRRNHAGADSAMDEVEKTVQSEAVDFQRNVGQSYQQFQQQNQQQWLRRNHAGADSAVDEVEKTVQSEAVDSR